MIQLHYKKIQHMLKRFLIIDVVWIVHTICLCVQQTIFAFAAIATCVVIGCYAINLDLGYAIVSATRSPGAILLLVIQVISENESTVFDSLIINETMNSVWDVQFKLRYFFG